MRDKITLYHATSSQVLLKIMEEGGLRPAGETGISSNGLGDINKRPSGNENGIYLAYAKEMAEPYSKRAVEKTSFESDMPNIGVILEVEVDKNRLQPDLDDWFMDKEIKDVPSWEKCLEEMGQVVHDGGISRDEIKSVQFSFHVEVGDILKTSELNKHQQTKMIRDTIPFKKEFTLDDSFNEIQKLHKKVKNKGLETAVKKEDIEKSKKFLADGAIPSKETKLMMVESKTMKKEILPLLKSIHPTTNEKTNGLEL